jgi:hypothetical protein
MFKRRVDKSDTIHQIYSNHKIKQQLIDYIFSVVDLSKFKYKLLEVKDDLQLLLSTAKFYISGNYTGPNCLMVFTKNKDRYYSFIVDRKTLSYKQTQINIDSVTMHPIELGLDESIYDGTIIDGILSQTENSKMYIITDVYLFRNKLLTNEKIKYKLLEIRAYLDAFLTQDKNVNNIDVMVNKLYDISDIKHLATSVIPQMKNPPVRGIAFYPETSGTKLIFLFNKLQNERIGNDRQNGQFRQQREQYHSFNKYSQNSQQSSYQRCNNYNQQNRRCDNFERNDSSGDNHSNSPEELPTIQKQKCRYVCKTDEQVVLTFELRKTDQTDVYKIFLVEKCTDGGKTILKTKKIGIACVPTSACSKMCREATISTGKSLIKCKYDDDKEKWIPEEIDKKRKCPDYVSTLEEKMDVIIDDE